jgi:hypothetical protein
MGKVSNQYGISTAYMMGALIMLIGTPLLLLVPRKKP